MSERMIQFFPWLENDEAHRISDRTPSATETHTGAMEFLSAGPQYDRAYRAVFDYEKAENIQSLAVPITVFRWKGSVLLKFINRLLSLPLPSNVHVVDTPLALSERYAAMLARFNAVKRLESKAPDFKLPQSSQEQWPMHRAHAVICPAPGTIDLKTSR